MQVSNKAMFVKKQDITNRESTSNVLNEKKVDNGKQRSLRR